MKKNIGVLLLILSMVATGGISFAADSKPVEPVITSTASDNYRIKAGDILDISVWKNDELNMTVMVDEMGKIDYPFLGMMDVGNKTAREVEATIAEGLNKDYIVNPKVSIRLNKQSLAFFVFGEVGKPGTYKYEGKIDILKAITIAGGFTDFASKKVKVIRKDESGKEHERKVDVKKLTQATQDRDKYMVEPGDTIIVERSWI